MLNLSTIPEKLEKSRHQTETGIEFWSARELQEILGYESFEKFENVIERAKSACSGYGQEPPKHFLQSGKKVSIGSGAKVERKDYMLSRYACYLVAMNGNPSKEEVAMAQTYFTVQTRRQEMSDLQDRLDWREKVRQATKELHSAATAAGVQPHNFGLFYDRGDKGLYGGIGLKEILSKKNIKENDSLFDHCGLTELAANAFRATQTKEALKKHNVMNEKVANETHYDVGMKVRNVIKEIGGTMPEDLPAEPSIKVIAAKQKKQLDGGSLGI